MLDSPTRDFDLFLLLSDAGLDSPACANHPTATLKLSPVTPTPCYPAKKSRVRGVRAMGKAPDVTVALCLLCTLPLLPSVCPPNDDIGVQVMQ